MKIIIWGLGFRGRTLIDYLGNQYIEAIVESDLQKVGTKYKGIEVISFEKYMEVYPMIPIIITPEYQYQKEISDQLMAHNIFHFAFSSELPPNIRYNGKFNLEYYFNMVEKGAKEVYFYGINAFSILLYLLLVKYNKKIFFIAEYDTLKANQIAICKLLHFQIVSQKSINNLNLPIYITTHEYKENIEKFYGRKAIDAFRFADEKKEYCNLELNKFKDKYKDKCRCFIVATGPSLTMNDLNILQKNNEFCFSVNSICRIETKWKPDIYVVSDGKFFSENQEMIRNYNCPIKLLPDDNIQFWENRKEGEYWIHRDSIDAYDILEFSEDITEIVNTQGTITVGCIQIAVFMGFKKIYLIGTDCNYIFGSCGNHFFKDSKPDMIDHSVSAMIKGYEMCRRYAELHNIKIYNATRGGMLEVFERADFDSLFQ